MFKVRDFVLVKICRFIYSTSPKHQHYQTTYLTAYRKLQRLKIRLFVRFFHKLNYDRKAQVHKRVTPLYKELSILKLCGLCYYNLAIPGHNYFHNNTLPKIAHRLKRYSDTSHKLTRKLGNNLFRLGTRPR